MFCIECGARFDDPEVHACPVCGAVLPAARQPARPQPPQQPDSEPEADTHIRMATPNSIERHDPVGAASRPVGWLAATARSARALFIVAGLLLAVVAIAVYGGVRTGLADRAHLQATAQAAEVARQFNLGLQDLAAHNYALAAERFRYVLSVDPGYPGAQEKLAQAQAGLGTASAPTHTPDPETARHLLEQAQAAYDQQDWSTAIDRLVQMQTVDPAFERIQADGMLYVALRNRGLERIAADRLEEGIYDLERASAIGPLDVDARQQREWAAIYLTANTYYGVNWPQAIQGFSLLYQLAPYFKDTISKLTGAHVAYGDALLATDACLAQEHYAAANEITFDEEVEAKRVAAEEQCAVGTPTPEPGTGTPEGLEATPSPAGSDTPTAIP